MQAKVSIKDIAKSLGVSAALVSYVLSGREKEARVGKEIAARIREKAAELNYQPNQIAKSLKSGKTYTIGLLVADISNPFFANIARIIEDEAKKSNYTVIFGSSDENPDKLRALIDVLLNRQVDGLIIVPTVGSELLIDQLRNQKFPFVLIDRYFPQIESSHISIDNHTAAYTAIVHLVNNGYRKIGMIAYNMDLVHMQERKRGYLDALKDHHLLTADSLLNEISYASAGEEVNTAITEAVSRNSIDAIFFATNALATHGLKSIVKLDLKVPDDLGIVTFDESDAFDFFYSPLTFVRQPGVQMAEEAVRVLLQTLQEKTKSPAPEHVCIPSELVVRKSSGPVHKLFSSTT